MSEISPFWKPKTRRSLLALTCDQYEELNNLFYEADYRPFKIETHLAGHWFPPMIEPCDLMSVIEDMIYQFTRP